MSGFQKLSALFLALGLAGCSVVPGSGPSRGDIVQSGTATADNVDAPFAVVEVDDLALDVLARRQQPFLRDYFGDYRPPVAQPIGVGDTVQVTLWEAAAGGLFSAAVVGDGTSPGARQAAIPEQVVGRDGTVSVPYAGRIHVAGRTRQEVEAAVIERLKGKAIEPQALVTVSRNISNTVMVTGEATNGGQLPLSLRGDRIMDVVVAAGGFHTPVHETFISLTRAGRTARAPVQALLANPRENIFVRPGDILTVEHTPQTFTVAGATGANGVVPFGAREVTLEEAIGRAGGLQDMRADPEGVFVLRYEPADIVREYPAVSPGLLARPWAPVAYHLNLRDPSSLFMARRFAMRDKDIIYVSNSALTEVGKFLRLFQMVTQPAIEGASLGAPVFNVVR